MAYRSLMSARVICCGDSCVGLDLWLWCILALIMLDDDNNIGDGVEKPHVANLAAGAAMNTARNVFKEVDLIVRMNRLIIEMILR